MKRFLIALVFGLFSISAAQSACVGLESNPLSSANSADVAIVGNGFEIADNNKVIVNGKATKNVFFNQEVEAPVFPQRLVKVRKFQVSGNKAITVDITVKTLTSQYRFADDTLPTRKVAISKLDAEAKVDCADDVIDVLSANSGTNTYTSGVTEVAPGEPFDGSIANPLQISIQEKGPDVTIVFKNLTLEPGEVYQLEFISQGEKSALQASTITEEYQVSFGSSSKVDLDNPGQGTVVDDDEAKAVFFAEDSETSLFSIAPGGTLDIGLTTLNGALARVFEDPDLDQGPYAFKLKQERRGKKYLVKIIDDTGKLIVKKSKKPFLKLANGGKAKASAKGEVIMNADGTQTKDDVDYSPSTTAVKYLQKLEAGSRARIKLDIKNANKANKGKVLNGSTNVTITNYEFNTFLGDDIVIEIEDPDADIDPRNMPVDGIINDPGNTPNGAYSFTVDAASLDAVILRKGKVLNLQVQDSPIDISVITDSIFVQNGVVPDDELGLLTIAVNDNGKALMNDLQIGDEVVILFDILSGDVLFEDNYGMVILRKE